MYGIDENKPILAVGHAICIGYYVLHRVRGPYINVNTISFGPPVRYHEECVLIFLLKRNLCTSPSAYSQGYMFPARFSGMDRWNMDRNVR